MTKKRFFLFTAYLLLILLFFLIIRTESNGTFYFLTSINHESDNSSTKLSYLNHKLSDVTVVPHDLSIFFEGSNPFGCKLTKITDNLYSKLASTTPVFAQVNLAIVKPVTFESMSLTHHVARLLGSVWPAPKIPVTSKAYVSTPSEASTTSDELTSVSSRDEPAESASSAQSTILAHVGCVNNYITRT